MSFGRDVVTSFHPNIARGSITVEDAAIQVGGERASKQASKQRTTQAVSHSAAAIRQQWSFDAERRHGRRHKS